MNYKIIDLSHCVADGTVTYKGLPPPVISDFWSREYSAQFYDDDTSFHIARIDMVVNTGTYIDVSFHRFNDGYDLAGTPIEKLANLEGICFYSPFEDQLEIKPDLFVKMELKNKAVLFNTGWSKKWGREEYQWNHPFLGKEAAEFLVSQEPIIVGIDSCNIDDTSGKSRPVHSILLKHGILIVEHLCNLDSLKDQNFKFFGIPPKIKGAGSFPIRAFAIIDS